MGGRGGGGEGERGRGGEIEGSIANVLYLLFTIHYPPFTTLFINQLIAIPLGT
jgi:hypothetical protein